MRVAIFLALIAASILLYLRFSKRANAKSTEKVFTYGPFTIKAAASTSFAADLKHGYVKQTDVAYSIFYEGKSIQFPKKLETNTGLPFLWSVYALPGAPTPSLIAGSQSLYLIFVQDKTLVVKPLVEQSSEFASLQFLDSENGQPGLYREVFMDSDPAKMETLDQLEGGRFLMISEHAVLDVKTLEIKRFNTQNESVDNYSFPSPHGALAFSPDQTDVVFQAEFQSWNAQDNELPETEHALVVYNFLNDHGYVVPYNDTETRMINVENNNAAWLNTYFEWKQDKNGKPKLQLRQLEKAPPWVGTYNPEDHYYTLYPVKLGMLPVFLNFVLQQIGGSEANILEDKTGEYTGRGLILASGELKLDINFKEDEQKLTFSKHLYAETSPEYIQLVEKIAGAFDQELSAGKHQEHFGRIISLTWQIRGIN
ncbi:hypothetical protein [Haliscomenobacter sp.]|uniref:hypothetical protein n=1 Tax=Haliscomenobacter sp. TaxID=2717303 RepID=UPI003BAD3F94